MKQIKNELAAGYEIAGAAKLTENQISSLERNRANLSLGHVYVIPAQVFHSHPDERSRTGYSNRCVAFDFDENGNKVGIVTLSLSSLRAAYLGKVIQGVAAPVIKCARRADGLMRPVNSAGLYKSNINGMAPKITTTTFNGVKTAAITEPFAFKVTGRQDFYQATFENPIDGPEGRQMFDMKVDADSNLVIDSRSDYTYDTVMSGDYQKKIDFKSEAPQTAEYAL